MAPATLQVSRGALEDRMVLTGELEALAAEQLRVPRTPAWTLAISWLAEDGAVVKKGEKVVEFDSTTLAESLDVSIGTTNQAPVLSGAANLAGINEDPSPNTGTLVSTLIAGQITDGNSNPLSGIAITAVNTANGNWQYTTNGGMTWTAVGAVSDTAALLLAADTNTRVRFVPNADWNGTVANALTFRAWDRTSGTAGNTADTSTNGGATAFSTATAGSSLTVTAVNDAPVRTGGAVNDLTVLENSGTTSLGLGALAYGNGGGADEAGQTLTFTVTAVPSATLGDIVLADNTTVVTVNTAYTLNQLQGMQFRAAAGANGGPLARQGAGHRIGVDPTDALARDAGRRGAGHLGRAPESGHVGASGKEGNARERCRPPHCAQGQRPGRVSINLDRIAIHCGMPRSGLVVLATEGCVFAVAAAWLGTSSQAASSAAGKAPARLRPSPAIKVGVAWIPKPVAAR